LGGKRGNFVTEENQRGGISSERDDRADKVESNSGMIGRRNQKREREIWKNNHFPKGGEVGLERGQNDLLKGSVGFFDQREKKKRRKRQGKRGLRSLGEEGIIGRNQQMGVVTGSTLSLLRRTTREPES